MSVFSFIKKFFAKSVDSIIADITSKVEQLYVVAEAHAEAEKIHQAEVAKRQQLSEAAADERMRAVSIAAKLTALVS